MKKPGHHPKLWLMTFQLKQGKFDWKDLQGQDRSWNQSVSWTLCNSRNYYRIYLSAAFLTNYDLIWDGPQLSSKPFIVHQMWYLCSKNFLGKKKLGKIAVCSRSWTMIIARWSSTTMSLVTTQCYNKFKMWQMYPCHDTYNLASVMLGCPPKFPSFFTTEI